MSSDYVITTPIKPTRTWTIPMYRRGIDRLDPPPKAVGIVTSTEVFEEYFGDDERYVLVAPHPPMNLEILDRIAQSRELLRRWFVHDRSEQYQWWIDSDIEVFGDTFLRLHGEMEKLNCLVLSNGYQGRGTSSVRNWHGIGCTLVDRRVADMSRFWFGRGWRADGTERHVCEDLLFFAAYEWCEWSMLPAVAPDCKKIRMLTDIAPVVHHWNGPQIEQTRSPRQDAGTTKSQLG